jgi:serine/alanine racemase
MAFDPGVFWYLEALMVCALVSWPFLARGKGGLLLAFGAACYVFGMFGDSYYGLVKDLPVVGDLYRAYFAVFVHVRKGLPFGLLFFAMGALFACREDRLKVGLGPLAAGLAVALGLRGLELALVSRGGLALDNSVSLFVAPPAILAFLLALRASPRIDDRQARNLRSMSSTLFFSHQFMLELVILFVRYSGIGIGGTLRWAIAVLLCLGLWRLASSRGPAFLRRMLNC